jgi:hypothetical protein
MFNIDGLRFGSAILYGFTHSVARSVAVTHVTTGNPAATQAVADATGAALQADIPRALAVLHRVPAEEFTGADHAFRAAMLGCGVS